MFCHKCGAQVAEGAAFCHKCGAKVVSEDAAQQGANMLPTDDVPNNTSTPAVEPQQADTVKLTIAEDTTNKFPKENRGLHIAANIGRVLMWGSLILLFFNLPISPAILVAGAAIGIILSALGAKRPLGLSKIIEMVVAVILLVVVAVTTLSSGGTGDKYVRIVKEGTLEAYPQITVGEAFDGFLRDPKWESGLTDDHVRFVNVTGGILYYEKDAELAVQFFVDEKDETFRYNACEIDGVPQNNLVFLGLLEIIYGDSSSKGLDSQGDPDFMSDKIVIGETQSYDDAYGNIEVTLNYAAFAGKLENTLLGGYIYPDAGNVFLWADIAVKNIGTKDGYFTASNTLVYDGTYEFQSYNLEGDLLSNIAPLAAPTEGALIFEVPTSVMESEKSLVLNINETGDNAAISFTIRSGNGGVDVTGGITNNPDMSGKVLYQGIPVDSIIGASAEDIIATWGQPDDSDEWFLSYTNNDALFSLDVAGDILNLSSSHPEDFVLNGQNLKQDYRGLVEIFGGESDSTWTTADSLEVGWYYGDYYFSLILDMSGETWITNQVFVSTGEPMGYEGDI